MKKLKNETMKLNKIYKIEEDTKSYINPLLGNEDYTFIIIAKNKKRAIELVLKETYFRENIGNIEILGYSPLKEEIIVF